eukprot:284818883_3
MSYERCKPSLHFMPERGLLALDLLTRYSPSERGPGWSYEDVVLLCAPFEQALPLASTLQEQLPAHVHGSRSMYGVYYQMSLFYRATTSQLGLIAQETFRIAPIIRSQMVTLIRPQAPSPENNFKCIYRKLLGPLRTKRARHALGRVHKLENSFSSLSRSFFSFFHERALILARLCHSCLMSAVLAVNESHFLHVRFCKFSCPAQAWSIGTILAFLATVAAPTPAAATAETPVAGKSQRTSSQASPAKDPILEAEPKILPLNNFGHERAPPAAGQPPT